MLQEKNKKKPTETSETNGSPEAALESPSSEENQKSSGDSNNGASSDEEEEDGGGGGDDDDDDDRSYWLMKAEPESRFEKGVDVKFSIDDLRKATKPEAWDGKQRRNEKRYQGYPLMHCPGVRNHTGMSGLDD